MPERRGNGEGSLGLGIPSGFRQCCSASARPRQGSPLHYD